MTIFCEASLRYINDQAVTEDDRILLVNKRIRDGRCADLPGWQESGFELMKHESAVSDWQDEQKIVDIHYEEIRELATKLTGCDFALVGSHIKRGPEQAKIHEDLAPITFVHSDFAASYGDLMRSFYSDNNQDASIGLKYSGASVEDVKSCKRLMILQFWRNLGEAKMDLPLAFCDARSVDKKDLRPFLVQDYAGDGFDFETLGIAPDDAHAWYVFPEMQQDEVVAFRTYDSARVDTDAPFWTPHAAFADPSVQPGQPSRTSIEIRATCLFR